MVTYMPSSVKFITNLDIILFFPFQNEVLNLDISGLLVDNFREICVI